MDFNLFKSDGFLRLSSEFSSVLEMLCWKLQRDFDSSDGQRTAQGGNLACQKNLLTGRSVIAAVSAAFMC